MLDLNMPNSLDQRGSGFSRNQRIKSSRLFEETFAQKRRLFGRFLAIWLRQGPGASLRLGVAAGRVFDCAVQRNQAKRRLREAFRLNRHKFAADVDVVLVARRAILTASWDELQKELLSLARRLGALKGEIAAELKN